MVSVPHRQICSWRHSLRGALVAIVVGCLSFLLYPNYQTLALARPIAGENSVYVPGAGFSGFWYHLGLFKSISTLDEYDYFCYSSGCLSIVLGFLNTDVEYAYDVCRDIQIAWSQGRMSSYEIIDEFLERLLPAEEKLFSSLFPRLNIISTSLDSGVEIRQAKNRTELLSYLRRTTRIPLLTGRAWLKDAGQRYVDGGFSRMFHPPCRWTVEIPVTWSTYIHSLNPGVSKERVFEFVELGLSGPNPFLVGSSKC
uniref:PNPLA domain-containing protein n=1 Tax=Amphora coffeiformis TaxID=265554 RepID=A0A7S3LF98_9STRA